MTGLGNSTVCGIVSEVTKAIINNLWSDQILRHFLRNKEEFRKKILDMEELWQFPCSWAAIDGCHIPLKCPTGGLQANKEYHKIQKFLFNCPNGHGGCQEQICLGELWIPC